MHSPRRPTLIGPAVLLLLLTYGCDGSTTVSTNPSPTAPTVSVTNPHHKATRVPINGAIVAAFSRSMNPSTMTTATFMVGGVTGTVTYADQGKAAIFTPASPLAPNTTYVATVTTGATDRNGTRLSRNYTWRFTTGIQGDTGAPSINAMLPAAGSTGVALNTAVTATFSEAMLPSSFTATTFTVAGLTGTVRYAVNGNTAIFLPSGPLTPNTTYTATLTTGVTDLAGTPLASNVTWSFTTGATTDSTAPTVTAALPPSGSTGVRLSSPISATFSEAILPSTITTETFTVAGVTGTVTYDPASRTTIFTPDSNLSPLTSYVATVTTGGTDLTGNPLAGNVSWTFTTGPAAALTVLYAFDGLHGADPKGSLTLVNVGNVPTLFGRTAFGGSGWMSSNPANNPGGGVIFSLALGSASPPISTYSFTDSTSLPTSGYQPHHDSMTLIGGLLYGTAMFTGAISENGTGDGTIFAVNPSASSLTTGYTALYNFTGSPSSGPDGANAHSAFGIGSNGATLYGASSQGGSNGDGTLYAVSLPGNTYLGTFFSFHKSIGRDPHGRPVIVNNGTSDFLLGMTKEGGQADLGVIYTYNTAPTLSTGTYTAVHNFMGPPNDGATTDHGNLTIGALTPASGASPATVTLYGLTTNGGTGTNSGSAGDGVLFQTVITLPNPPATPSAVTSILHNFGGPAVTDLVTGDQIPDGYSPFGSLLLANGWLYGTTRDGGANGGGVIFRMSPDPACSGENCYGILASFDSHHQNPATPNLTGGAPIDNVIISPDGSTLFGMTEVGGANDPTNAQPITFGTVFSILATP